MVRGVAYIRSLPGPRPILRRDIYIYQADSTQPTTYTAQLYNHVVMPRLPTYDEAMSGAIAAHDRPPRSVSFVDTPRREPSRTRRAHYRSPPPPPTLPERTHRGSLLGRWSPSDSLVRGSTSGRDVGHGPTVHMGRRAAGTISEFGAPDGRAKRDYEAALLLTRLQDEPDVERMRCFFHDSYAAGEGGLAVTTERELRSRRKTWSRLCSLVQATPSC